jgi:cytoskeletal protein RodZ
MPEQMPSSLLKDAREAKGLTLDIVHEATKIPMDALKAIEQGYSVKMLTPFYYRGFVKIYAEFLGVDPTEAIKAYNAEKAAPVVAAPIVRKKVPNRPQPPNVAGEQFQEFVGSVWSAKNRKMLLRLVGFIVVVFVLFKFVGCVATSLKNRPKAAAVKQKSSPKPKETPKPKSAGIVIEPQATESVVKAQSSNQKVELTVRAVKNTWIQVKADGKTVFSMAMQKGTVESWSARDQIELSGKNINELELEVNGKNIGSLGSGERQAKRVVITKDGLTVKK